MGRDANAIAAHVLIWVAPWLRWMPKTTINEKRVTATISAADIFRQRSSGAHRSGIFASLTRGISFYLWLPLYLVRERHQFMQDMALHAALFFVIYALVAPITGCIADACIRAGADVTIIRKTFMAIGHSLVVLGVLACAASDARLSFTGMLVMGGGLGFTGPNIFAFAQTFAGPAAAGKWIGMQNSLGNISGVVVGPLTGLIVDHTGHFGWAFVVCAAVTFVGGISWTRLVGRLEQAPWRAESQAVAAGSATNVA